MQLKCPVCGTELNKPSPSDRDYFTECPKCHAWLHFNSQKQKPEIIESITPKEHPVVFFSHSFGKSDAGINETFRTLLLFFYMNVYTIERDTRAIDKIQKARERIEDSDFVFIVMPKRYQCYDEEGGNYFYKSSEWIQNEVGMAYANEKDIIAVIEEGVKDEGMLKDIRWCYSFNRGRLSIPWIEDIYERTPEEAKNELLDTLNVIST